MKYIKRSEDTEQINVVSWAHWNVKRFPELKWLYHVPNGGRRNRAEAAKFKQMGVKAGVSDLCLPYPKGAYCGLFIEMKYGSNKQQASQKEFLRDMAMAGHFVVTCYSAREACEVIEEYCSLPAFGADECIYRKWQFFVYPFRNIHKSISNRTGRWFLLAFPCCLFAFRKFLFFQYHICCIYTLTISVRI
nr:MAG TPA: Nuclease [Caudoviricetes sp.]